MGGHALTHRQGQHGVPWWSLRGLGPPEETESQLRLPRVPPGLLESQATPSPSPSPRMGAPDAAVASGTCWQLLHGQPVAGRTKSCPVPESSPPSHPGRDGCWVCFGLVLGEVGWGYIWVSTDGHGTRVLQIISGHWAGVMMLVSGPTDMLVSGMGGCNDTEPAGCHLRLRARCERPSGPPGPEQALQPRGPCPGEVGGGQGAAYHTGRSSRASTQRPKCRGKSSTSHRRTRIQLVTRVKGSSGPGHGLLGRVSRPLPVPARPSGVHAQTSGRQGAGPRPEVTVTFPGHLEPPGEPRPLLTHGRTCCDQVMHKAGEGHTDVGESTRK